MQINLFYCAGNPLAYHLKLAVFSLGQKQALDMCFGTLASFFIPLKTSCVLTALKKERNSRVWSIHTFALASFIIQSVNVPFKPQQTALP